MLEDLEVSLYASCKETKKVKDVNLFDILEDIRSGKFKNEIEKLRSLKDTDQFDNFKRSLPAFTPSGTFGEARKKEYLVCYSSIIVLDFDHIGAEQAKRKRDILFLFSHCLAAFLSPSGDGLKALILTDSAPETHTAVFNRVADFYEEHLGISVDRSGKDINRLSFVSYDPFSLAESGCSQV